MSEYTDDMSRQNIAGGMLYGFTFEPPHGPPHRCPGCQPCPDEPQSKVYWQRWHDIDRKWIARGDKSACPIVRGETIPVPYTDDDRRRLGIVIKEPLRIEQHKSDPPKPVTPYVPRRTAVEVGLDDEVEIVAAPKKQEKPKASSASTPRTTKAKSKTNQGTLF
jgi:hypothetical protein